MSPRAAWRLESLGFTQVYDYAAGKADWVAAGLPTEGDALAVPRIGDLARRDVPTCRLDERAGDLVERVRAAGFDTCLVVNGDRVVFGRLYLRELSEHPDERAEDLMHPGPSTFRPNIGAPDMVGFMHQHEIKTAPVTTSDGRLVGLLLRDEAERTVRESHAAHHRTD